MILAICVNISCTCGVLFCSIFFNILKHRTEFLSYFEDKYCQVWAEVDNTPTNIQMHRTASPPIVNDLGLFRAFLTWSRSSYSSQLLDDFLKRHCLGRRRRARGEVIDLHLALYVRLPGKQLGEDGELVVDLLEHDLNQDAEGHLGQSEMSIRSRDHVWTNAMRGHY